MTSTAVQDPASAARTGTSSTPVVSARDRLPYVLSGALVVVAGLSATLSLLVPSQLTGSTVSTGNMRGTALALLVVGLPVFTMAVVRTARGSPRALVVALGTLGYLLYQAVLFCFAVPLNNLFLLYVADLGLSLWTLVAFLLRADLAAFGGRLSPRTPVKRLAAVALTLAALNAAAWLAQIIPATTTAHPRTLLADTGLLTNPVFVQDLAVWLPLLTAAAIACWHRRSWGVLVVGAMLAMFVLESVSIASDQWFGSRADPSSPSASMAAVPLFAGVAVVLALVLVWYSRHLDRS